MNSTYKPTIALLMIIPLICLAKCTVYQYAITGPLDIAYILGKRYYVSERYEEMAQEYEKLVRKYPDKTDLCYGLGWAYYKCGRFADAWDMMQRYTHGNPFYPSWRLYYIEIVRKAALDAR